MKLIDEIRRDNIDRLQKECGSLKALAELLQRDPSLVSQWKQGSKHSASGKRRGIRGETARYIEERTGKAPGWLDQDHGEQATGMTLRLNEGMTAPLRAWEHPDSLPPGYSVFIPRMDVGQDPKIADGQVTISLVTSEPQAFDAEFINSDQLKPIKLGYIETIDDSMAPAIQKGDKCVIDCSQTKVVDGRTFAIWYDGTTRLRRLFPLPGGGLRIEADNPRHPPMALTVEQSSSVTILGRVVYRGGRTGL